MSMMTSSTLPSVNQNCSLPVNGASSAPPQKYLLVNGIMQLNPQYVAYSQSNGQSIQTARNPSAALPVISTIADAEAYQELLKQQYGTLPNLAPSTTQAIHTFQQPEVASRIGLSSSQTFEGLEAIFAKYEVPLGMMNKLFVLGEFDKLEFIVDDSGSMNSYSDTKDAFGQPQTRWIEARGRLKEMLEVLAYIPTPPIEVRFLNSAEVVSLIHDGERQSPLEFIAEAHRKVEAAFQKGPGGSTPLLRVLQASFQRGQGQRVSRYLFCDGEPNGGKKEQKQIFKLVETRADPKGNPITFLSCTGDDDKVEWMKEAEEIAPYAAEYDDLSDEQDEVARDQGEALPFTKGFHLVGQLVGAMNPHDLDALDESVPLTKAAFDNIMGVERSENDYLSYFEGFQAAQRKRQVQTKLDRIKKNYNWGPLYGKFLQAEVAQDIPEVRQFQKELNFTYSRNPVKAIGQLVKRIFS